MTSRGNLRVVPRLSKCGLVAAALIGVAALAYQPQKGKTGHPTYEQFKEQMIKTLPAPVTGLGSFGYGVCEGLESKVQESCIDAYVEYFRNERNVYGQRRADYDFQLTSTRVILWMVVVLVLVGVACAAMQFWYGLIRVPAMEKHSKSKNAEPPSATTSAQNADSSRSTIEISASGLKITSSVIGLLLLVVSMGFFFLYIRYVYPIVEGPAPTVQTSLGTGGK